MSVRFFAMVVLVGMVVSGSVAAGKQPVKLAPGPGQRFVDNTAEYNEAMRKSKVRSKGLKEKIENDMPVDLVGKPIRRMWGYATKEQPTKYTHKMATLVAVSQTTATLQLTDKKKTTLVVDRLLFAKADTAIIDDAWDKIIADLR